MRGQKLRLKSAGPVRTDAGISEFSDAMRETDLARVQVEERNLLFEKRRHQDLVKERAAELEQHTADRGSNTKNYMDRLMAMLDYAVNYICSATQKDCTVY